MHVYIQTQSKTKVKIDVVPDNTICDVKTKILKWFKPDQIGRVSVGAVTLKDETLQQYDIKTGDTINVFLTYPSCKCDHEICTFVDVYGNQTRWTSYATTNRAYFHHRIHTSFHPCCNIEENKFCTPKFAKIKTWNTKPVVERTPASISSPQNLKCTHTSCHREFKSVTDKTKHQNTRCHALCNTECSLCDKYRSDLTNTADPQTSSIFTFDSPTISEIHDPPVLPETIPQSLEIVCGRRTCSHIDHVDEPPLKLRKLLHVSEFDASACIFQMKNDELQYMVYDGFMDKVSDKVASVINWIVLNVPSIASQHKILLNLDWKQLLKCLDYNSTAEWLKKNKAAAQLIYDYDIF